MAALRVLLSEGSSLTARETLTCLGSLGHRIEVVDPDPLCVARFSRWTRRVHRGPCAAEDPRGYLETVGTLVEERAIDVVLPTHEQAWLFAVGAELGFEIPVAVAPAAAFDRVQGKVAFAELLEVLALPQPLWRPVRSEEDLSGFPLPYWLKADFGTAGRTVRAVRDEPSRAAAIEALLAGDQGPAMAQRPAEGQYGQAQALFAHGRLLAVHTSVRRGVGMGGSAAARVGVDHPVVRGHVAALGEALDWHGGITLDYFHVDGAPSYIECNPRTVEPGNAAASGVNLPELQIALTRGEDRPPTVRAGRAGVRTHGLLALLLGAADRGASRRDLLGEVGAAIRGTGIYADSAEQLTPWRDPPSLAALAAVLAQLLVSPRRAGDITAGAVRRYSVGIEGVRRLRAGASPDGPA
ncbi:MAG TPA: hypothetical protein VHA80_12435 [Solirubrobacterales bacterium]|nr:hypothetical protein [Solirubrobacterales bacterium]